MTEKSKKNKAERQAESDRKAKIIINCIFGALIGLGLIYLIYACINV